MEDTTNRDCGSQIIDLLVAVLTGVKVKVRKAGTTASDGKGKDPYIRKKHRGKSQEVKRSRLMAAGLIDTIYTVNRSGYKKYTRSFEDARTEKIEGVRS